MAKYLDYLALQELVLKIKSLFEPFNAVQTTTDTVANVIDVPTSAKGLATLKRIGGMSYKCSNLLNATATPDVDNETITAFWVEVTANTPYFLSFSNPNNQQVRVQESDSVKGFGTELFNNYSAGQSFTSSTNYVWVIFWKPFNNFTNIMLNLGSTALPYEAYYDGIRNSAVTKVESVGANLFDKANAVVRDNGFYNNTGYFEPNNDYACYGVFLKAGTYQLTYNGSWYGSISKLNSDDSWNSNVMSLNSYSNSKSFTLANDTYVGISVEKIKDFMLNYGSTALAYTPYVEHELAIASGIRSLTGYGWGVNENCYNYVDFTLKQYCKYVGRVDLGSLTWLDDGTNRFYASLSNSVDNLLCAKYEHITAYEYTNRTSVGILIDSNNILVYDTTYSSASDFKTAMSGVYLYYELATPVITDISSLLDEVHIPIEAGGTLELVNTYNNAVPMSVTFDNGLVDVVLTNHEHDIEQQKDIDELKSGKQNKLIAGSGIDITGNTISLDVTLNYKNILRLVDSSTGNPVFIISKVDDHNHFGTSWEDVNKTIALNEIAEFGETYSSADYVVVDSEFRDYIQIDKTGTTDLFEVVYQGLIGVKYDPSASGQELTVCFLDDANNVVIDISDVGDTHSAPYYFEGVSLVIG